MIIQFMHYINNPPQITIFFYSRQTTMFYDPKQEGNRSSKYNSFQTFKGNIIWAAALSLAWKEFSRNVLHHPKIQLTTYSYMQYQLVQNYNQSKITSKDIQDKSIYIKSGFGQQTVNLINKEIKLKFPEITFPELTVQLEDNEGIAYAYLSKKISFEFEFQRSQKQIQFNGKMVDIFKAVQSSQIKQVLVSRYQNKEDFIVFLRDKINPSERLYLIKKAKQVMMDEIIEEVCKVELEAKETCLSVNSDDEFWMPVVKLDCERSVEELKGSRIQMNSLQSYVLTQIMEGIKLKIDETGAKVENYGGLGYRLECYTAPTLIHLNRPFWVVMKEQGKHPYFCAYIADPNDF